MADINYLTSVDWDASLRDVGFADADDPTLKGLAESAIKMTAGAPAAVAGHWMRGGKVINEADGTEFRMTGTTASPAWTAVGTGGSGITQLTGDVTAGPGAGSQAATIAANAVTTAKILNANVTTAKIANLAITTALIAANAVDGTKIALSGQVLGDLMYYNGTDWLRIPIGTVGQVLTVVGGIPAWA